MVFLIKAFRIAVFLVLIPFFMWICDPLLVAIVKPETNVPLGVAVMAVYAAMAWIVSGIPIYWRRYKARSTSLELALR